MNLLSMLRGQNPAKRAMPYFNQIPTVASQQLSPYIQQGQQAGQMSQDIYRKMAANPVDFYNQLMNNYSLSKGYQYQMDEGERALRSAAAAGGYAGTPRHQQEAGELLQRILSQGQNEYINNIMNILSGGLSGQEMAAKRGYDANATLSDYLTSNLAQQGNLAFRGQQERNRTKQDLLGLIGNLAGSGLGYFMNRNRTVGAQRQPASELGKDLQNFGGSPIGY